VYVPVCHPGESREPASFYGGGVKAASTMESHYTPAYAGVAVFLDAPQPQK